MAVTYSTPGNRFHHVYQAISEEVLAVETKSALTFSRMFTGYNPAAVDTYIEVLTNKQQALLEDVESLKARLKESGDEAAALRKELATLTDSSPSPHAMQHRMAKMMRRAVDEISEMQAESRAEADSLITAAEAEVEAAQRKHRELAADMAAQRKTLEGDFKAHKKKLEVELSEMRAETQSAIDELWQEAQQEREQLIADAKLEAGHYREQAQREVDEASEQRINILERLMGVYCDLEAVPATLELAYRERRNPPEGTALLPLEQKSIMG
jgi:cell division septum initiation protein DivIVA